MVYSLLRVRKVSPFGISRLLQGLSFETPFLFSVYRMILRNCWEGLEATYIETWSSLYNEQKNCVHWDAETSTFIFQFYHYLSFLT